MSQTFFSKQDVAEKQNRLNGIASVRGKVTLWLKGSKDKKNFTVTDFDKERTALVLDTKDNLFPINSQVLCTFEYRGMNFFSQVTFQKSIVGLALLIFNNDFYKSERRNSYRLMTYPQFQIWCEIDLGKFYEGGNVVGLKNRISQTGIFKNFLKLVNSPEETGAEASSMLKIRVQDLSTTGMSIHIGELEKEHFAKDKIFENVNIRFTDSVIQVPKIKVMYLVPYVGADRNLKQYKAGIHFENIPTIIDEALGKKINDLLRQNDNDKDFENFLK